MAKREYQGPPIDSTMTHISELDNGETIGATTEDDLFGESTEWLPDHIDESDLSSKQKNAVMAYLSQSDKENISFDELADGRDFSRVTAERAIHKVFQSSREFDDLTDGRKLAVLICAHHRDSPSSRGLAEHFPISRRVIGEVRRVYPDLIKEVGPVSAEMLDDAVEQYKSAHPERTKSSTTNHGPESNVNKAIEEKEYPADFTDRQKFFIEFISDNPTEIAADAAKAIPESESWSRLGYYTVLEKFPCVIKRRIAEKGTINSWVDLDSNKAEKLADCDEEHTLNGSTLAQNRERDDEGKDEGDVTVEEESKTDYGRRLDDLETQIKSLSEKMDGDDEENQSTDLAKVIINSLSDEDLGEIIRDSI